jgi:hypothetical protein
MYQVHRGHGVTLICGQGELTREELSTLAALAAAARESGQKVVIDLKQVDHLHYAGAAMLKLRGLRAAGASPYVRDLVRAGGAGAYLEMYKDVEEATRAA